MQGTVLPLIVQDRKIAYILTGRDLSVVETGGRAGMLGSDPSAWLGRPVVDLLPELVGSESMLDDILAGRLLRFELNWVNREGAEEQTLYWNISVLPHRASKGEIVGLLLIVEDETEAGILQQALAHNQNELRLLRDQLARKNLELQASTQELLRLNGLKSEFVSVAAHELRTPLTSIGGYVEMLLDGDFGPLSDEQSEPLRIMQRSVNRLAALTSELLDAVRIEAGRVELVLRPTDLPALAKTVSEELQPQFRSKSQQLTLQAAPGLPLALCDPGRAGQIVRNLLSNASQWRADPDLHSTRRRKGLPADIGCGQRHRHRRQRPTQPFQPLLSGRERLREGRKRSRPGSVHHPRPGGTAWRAHLVRQ